MRLTVPSASFPRRGLRVRDVVRGLLVGGVVEDFDRLAGDGDAGDGFGGRRRRRGIAAGTADQGEGRKGMGMSHPR
jgi:hypothetical protein